MLIIQSYMVWLDGKYFLKSVWDFLLCVNLRYVRISKHDSSLRIFSEYILTIFFLVRPFFVSSQTALDTWSWNQEKRIQDFKLKSKLIEAFLFYLYLLDEVFFYFLSVNVQNIRVFVLDRFILNSRLRIWTGDRKGFSEKGNLEREGVSLDR